MNLLSYYLFVRYYLLLSLSFYLYSCHIARGPEVVDGRDNKHQMVSKYKSKRIRA